MTGVLAASLVTCSSVGWLAFSMGLVEVGLLLVVDELEDLDLEVAELVSCRAVVLVLPVTSKEINTINNSKCICG